MARSTTNIAPRKPRSSWPFKTQLGQRSESSGPRVSVIIPSYNQGEYLEAAIRSVLCQDYPNLECLVLDGGSQDESAEIITHYQSALAYSRSQPDAGQSAAVNEGAQNATGSIMSFLNSDDMLAPGAIATAVEALSAAPEIMLVHGHRILIDAKDQVAGWTHSAPFDPKHTLYTINSETAYWRRSIYEELGGFNESLRFALDLEFFCRIYVQHPIKLVDEYLGYYRFHSQSKSETISDIGASEASEHWQKIFGLPFPGHRGAKRSFANRINHFAQAFKKPRTLLIPYLKYKLKAKAQ